MARSAGSAIGPAAVAEQLVAVTRELEALAPLRVDANLNDVLTRLYFELRGLSTSQPTNFVIIE